MKKTKKKLPGSLVSAFITLTGYRQHPPRSALNVTSNGPPQRQCEVCHQNYTDWEAEDQYSRLVLPEFHPKNLCEADFLRLLQQQGHSTANIQIRHDLWTRRLAGWQSRKHDPANRMHLNLATEECPEILPCRMFGQTVEGLLEVELVENSFLNRSIKKRDQFLAEWTGILHGVTGRPVLLPIMRRVKMTPQSQAQLPGYGAAATFDHST